MDSLKDTYSDFYPGVFVSKEDGDDFLASLNPDTKEYVLNHTDEFTTRNELIDCVSRFYGVS